MGELKGNSIDRILIEPFASIHERGNIKQTLEFVCIRHCVLCQTECANMKKITNTQIFGKLLMVLLQYGVGKITVMFFILLVHSLQPEGKIGTRRVIRKAIRMCGCKCISAVSYAFNAPRGLRMMWVVPPPRG